MTTIDFWSLVNIFNSKGIDGNKRPYPFVPILLDAWQVHINFKGGDRGDKGIHIFIPSLQRQQVNSSKQLRWVVQHLLLSKYL